MKLAKYLSAVAAATLAVTPALAAPVKADVARASTVSAKKNEAAGGGVIVAILAAAAVIAGIIIVANEDDDPDSN